MNKHSVKGEVKVLGIDLSKRSFQLHGVDKYGNVVLRKKLSRKRLLESMVNLAPCVVGMEARAIALCLKSREHPFKIILIPSSATSLVLNTCLVGLLFFEKIKGNPS